MAVNVWANVPQTVSPVVTVFDCKGRLVASEVLLAGGGVCSIRVPAIKANDNYYVSVSGTSQPGWSGVGNYSLSIDFQNATAPDFTLSDNLETKNPQDFRSLTVNQAQLFHFELTAAQRTNAVPIGVQMVIFAPNSQAVFSTVALAGLTSRNDVWLAAGTYTVRFWAFSVFGGNVLSMAYTLLGYGASDAIGLTSTDTTLSPATTSTSGSSTTPTTSTTSSTDTSFTYAWTTTDPTLAVAVASILDPTKSNWWL
jgi:hypothetical protein